MESIESTWSIKLVRLISGVQTSEFSLPEGQGKDPLTLTAEFQHASETYRYIEVLMYRRASNPLASQARYISRRKRFRDLDAYFLYLNRLLAAGWISGDSYHRAWCLGLALGSRLVSVDLS